MTPIRLAALSAVLMLMLSACGQDESQAPAATSAAENPLLSYVPLNTPFLAANLEPTPSDVIDGFLQKMEPVMATMQVELASLKAQIEANPESARQDSKLLLALLQELDGKLNRAGLESLGFDLQSFQVIYGVGPYPAARLTLKDSNALKATVQRVLDNAGIARSESDYQGQAYWKIPDGQQGDSDAPPFSLFIAILPDHLAIGAIPERLEAEMLPAFLGKEKPGSSDARERLAALNQKYGYQPYFTGVMDLNLMADQFFNPDTILARSLDAELAAELSALSDQCKAEFRQIISHSPRLIAGTTELQPEVVGMQYLAEMPPGLAGELVELLAEIPMANELSSRLLEFSFGIKVGATRDFLREKATAIAQEPYQCEHLLQLNDYAAQGLERLEQPIPPFINNFRGVRLSLSALNMGGSLPYSGAGLLAVYVVQPEMFVGMAQMFLPDLSELNLVKGEPPVPVPASLLPVPDVVTFAAISDSAIGISVNEDETGLPPFLNEEANSRGILISANYDTAAYMDFSNGMSDSMEALSAQDENEGENDEAAAVEREQAQMAKNIVEAIEQSYRSVVDRSMMDVRFTSDGVIVDSRMTFK